MKLVSKLTGEEIVSFSVVVNDFSLCKNFTVISKPTKLMIDQHREEYTVGSIHKIIYNTKDNTEMITWKPGFGECDNIIAYEWLNRLRKNSSFEVTTEMIEDAKKHGPFFIIK